MGLLLKALFKGIEIIPERVETLKKIIKKYRIKNIEVIEANANGVDFSDGNVFFIFNPFSGSTLRNVSTKLKELAKTKKITIIAHGACVNHFKRQKWLRRTINLNDWAQALYGNPLSLLWIFRKVFWLQIYRSV